MKGEGGRLGRLRWSMKCNRLSVLLMLPMLLVLLLMPALFLMLQLKTSQRRKILMEEAALVPLKLPLLWP